MLSSFITLFALASATIAAPVAELGAPVLDERAGPDLQEVYIKNITYGGSGCPQNSVGQFISDDRETFTLIFDSYEAEIGPNTKPSDTRKNCQINIDLHYPQGFQYSILKTTFRGYLDLDAGVTAKQSALYYFSGPSSSQVTTSQSYVGPKVQDYTVESDVGITSLIWSPCGANWPLNVNTQIALTSTKHNANGLITRDSADGHLQYVTGIQWRQC